jgi:hypothetical protein
MLVPLAVAAVTAGFLVAPFVARTSCATDRAHASPCATASAPAPARAHPAAPLDLAHVVGAWTAGPKDGVLVLDGVRGTMRIPPGRSLADARLGEWHLDGHAVIADGERLELVYGPTRGDDRLVAQGGPAWRPLGDLPVSGM